jgi:hypothetical protein
MGRVGRDGKELADGTRGDGRVDDAAEALTVPWFDGRMCSEGERGAGGGGICCEDGWRDAFARQ